MSFGMLSGISIVFFIVIVEELLKGRNIGLALLFIASSLFSGLLAISSSIQAKIHYIENEFFTS